MSVVARATIFDIHLIQAEICSHLSRRDIRRCTLVSRALRASFLPHLWRDISITHQSTLNRFRQFEYQAALTQHAYYVQSITTVYVEVWPLMYTPCEVLRSNRHIDTDSSAQGQRTEIHLKRVFPNLRSIQSLSLEQRRSSVLDNSQKVSLILPMLDPAVVPRLESITITHFNTAQRAMFYECMERVHNLTTLKKLRIEPKNLFVPCEMYRRIVECIPQVEAFSMDIRIHHRWGCLKEARQDLEEWLQGESPDESFYESPLDTSLTIVPSFNIKKGRIFVDTKPFERYWTMETPMATTVATAERFSVVSRFPLKLPSRFAIKDLEFGFALFDYGETTSIAAFLERCPDIERLVVPAGVLHMSLCSVLLELLPNWIRLKEMVIGEFPFYVEESTLAEILRLASQSGRRYGRHPQQDQQQILNSVLDAGDSGDGLESLCIGGGSISFLQASQAIIAFHGRTLVRVTLVNSRIVDRSNLQRLLCSCPNLEILEAMSTLTDKSMWTRCNDPVLSSEDILAVSGPAPATKSVAWGWVCTRLRVLKLRYLSREPETGWDTGIPYELAVQLSRMRCLEDLRLGRMAGDMRDRSAEIIALFTSMSASVSTGIPLTDLNSVMRDDNENPEVSGNDGTLSTMGTTDQQTKSNECHLEEETRRRTESVTMALRIFARELSRLKTLELRGLKTIVVHDEIRNAKKAWKQMEWVQYR